MFPYVPSFVRTARSQKHKYEKSDGVVNTDLVGSSLRFHTDAEDIHNGLLANLITEYFINDSKAAGNIVRWKMHFRKCCRLPYHQDGDILENFCFLEQTGQLSVGKYDILENIFYHVDKRALLNIKDASSKINGLKSATSGMKTLGRTCFAEIRVRLLKKRCPAIEKELAYILNNFASSLDEMPLSYTPFSLDKLEHHSLNSDSKMDLRMIKETKIPYIYPHLSKLINDISEKLQHLISPYNRDYVRSSEIIVQYLLSFIENLKKNYNIRKLRFDWKESIVIYVAFDDVFDKNKFIDHRYLLRERTGTMFSLIFEHVNNIRLDNPFIEINTLTMSDSPCESNWNRFWQ
ncbi:uncharacterized protein [Magallana gigas]|uniref:uncharacterized protein n=1 Tax=Magallana gigas TaxID=29159 RepID=UPI00333E6123